VCCVPHTHKQFKGPGHNQRRSTRKGEKECKQHRKVLGLLAYLTVNKAKASFSTVDHEKTRSRTARQPLHRVFVVHWTRTEQTEWPVDFVVLAINTVREQAFGV
jgi:hypothetical protein